MKTWRLVFALAAAFVLGIAFAVLGGSLRLQKGKSPAEYQTWLGQQLPVGSDKRDVIAQLDQSHIEHSAYLDRRNVILAIIRNSCWSIFLECSVDFEFQFDEGGKLTRITAKEGYTGL